MSKTATPEARSADPADAAEAPIPRGYWQDASGNLIPIAKIRQVDKDRHQLVCAMADEARAMSEQLRDFKANVMAAISNFVDRSAEEYGVTVRGAAGKGNITLVSFDGRFKVVRAVQESIAFDERLQVAKALIDECVHLWAKGANKNIQALVNHAFQVDKEGKVSTGRVLGLRTLNIDDAQWKRAMDAIADSMRTASSKSYVRFYERNAAGEYVAISLDVSSV